MKLHCAYGSYDLIISFKGEYTPSDPSIWSNYYPDTNRPNRAVITRFPPPLPGHMQSDINRELINVPVNNSMTSKVYHLVFLYYFFSLIKEFTLKFLYNLHKSGIKK